MSGRRAPHKRNAHRQGLAAKRAPEIGLALIQRAIISVAKLPNGDVVRVKAMLSQALRDFSQASQCSHNWAVMADALNVAEALSDQRIASDDNSRRMIRAAMEALAAVRTRFDAGGSWTLRATELQALDDGLFIHGVQLEHCCYREYEAALTRAKNVCAQALAGNAPPGVLVLGDLTNNPNLPAA